jgi:hypothetical protein
MKQGNIIARMIQMLVEFKDPFRVKDATIVSAEVRHIGFAEMTTLSEKAFELIGNEANKYRPTFQRERLKAQTRLFGADKKAVDLDDFTLMGLPIPAARAILAVLDSDEARAGEILTPDADGISTPILFKLGKPIKVRDNKSAEDGAITEIEIQARNYGDIEAVLCESTQLSQTVELIKSCAKPAGLLAMPAWALAELSIADGMLITTKILPRFLE